MEAYFPSGSGVSVIAEPGNFFVFSSSTLAVNVIGKKSVYRYLHGEIHSKSHLIWFDLLGNNVTFLHLHPEFVWF